MKVRMVGWVSGTRDGVEWPAPGETVELPSDEAAALLAAGIAVEAGDAVESAAAEPAERAVEPGRKPRKRS